MNDATEQPEQARNIDEERTPLGISAKTQPKDVLAALVDDLHNLILVLIAAVLYYDTFSLLFFLRFFSQNQSTNNGVRIVLFSASVNILTHLFHDLTRPEKREIWNHGGLLVDFVGERPASRTKLICCDFLILGLQILYLALHYKRASIDTSISAKAPPPAQDLDAEEAGISRADPPATDESEEGIEMQSLLPRASTEQAREGLSSQAQPLEDMLIVLRKQDFKEVFLSTTHSTGSDTSSAQVQGFWERFNAIRARRAALQSGGTSTTAPA